jgi:uracil-DNA glycosylase
MTVPSYKHLKFWKHFYLNSDLIDLGSKNNTLPARDKWFQALELTPFDKVKVVLLGQDPYHTKGMAHGLAFSVLPHNKGLPASLRNIFKEYQADLGYPQPRNGDLRTWASRGVLLLNTILTVEEGKPLSHKGIGWEKLTYEIIRELATKSKVVFILLGKQAQEYKAACDPCPVVAAAHPSPLSAASGFHGSKIFSKANQKLEELGVEKVDWRLP